MLRSFAYFERAPGLAAHPLYTNTPSLSLPVTPLQRTADSTMIRGCFTGFAKPPRAARETYGDRSEGEYACPSFAGEPRIPFRDLCETFRSGLIDDAATDASGGVPNPLPNPPHPASPAPGSSDTFGTLQHTDACGHAGKRGSTIRASTLPHDSCPTCHDAVTSDTSDATCPSVRVRFKSTSLPHPTPEDASASPTKPDAVEPGPEAVIEDAPKAGDPSPVLKLQSSSGPRTLRALHAARAMRSSRASFDPRASTGSGWNECGALDEPGDPSELARTMTGLLRESWSSDGSTGSGRGSGRILSSRGEACGDVAAARAALALDGQPAWIPRTFGRKLSRKLSFLVSRQKSRTTPAVEDGGSADVSKAGLAVRS